MNMLLKQTPAVGATVTTTPPAWDYFINFKNRFNYLKFLKL
jgi:hypothetical protein